MIGSDLKFPRSCSTSEGHSVTSIELRGNGEVRLSGIIKHSDSKSPCMFDDYVSWNLEGKDPSIKKFGNLLL